MRDVQTRPDVVDRVTPTLGAPLAPTTIRVLDPFLRPVGDGGTGELYVAGPQLARGYLGEPGATAVRFVADPDGPPGSRMYRTGDIVRWSSTGGLVFVGRADNQLKVRGFRVDLADLEHDALQVPGVTGAVGTVLDGVPHVVVTTATDGPDGAEVHALLRARVPAHRVPATVGVVDRIPLTRRGKVDHRALRVLVGQAAAMGPADGPADTADARLRTLVDVFAEVLGDRSAGPDTDFFAAGGHSLLALRVVARVNAELGIRLTARDLFGATTPRSLLDHVLERGATSPDPMPDAVAPAPETVSGEVALSRSQTAIWYLERTVGGGSLYAAAVAQHLTGTVDLGALQAAVHDVVRRHPSLRSVFPEVAGRPVRRELDPTDPAVVAASAVEVHDCAADEVEARASEAARRPTDLVGAPPWGVALVRSGDTAVLVLRTHHVVCDGWSAQVLAHDLGAAYSARRRGEAPAWSGPVRRRAGEPTPAEAARSEEYWTTMLRGAPHRTELPTDRPRPSTASFAGFSRHRRVAGGLAQRLADLAAQHGVTPFTVLHAALTTALHRLGAGDDIVLGTPVAGRDADDADVVDMFVNTLVLRTQITAATPFDEVLSRSRAAVHGALQHQDISFERVVELVRPPRSSSTHPIFQVLLSLDDTPRRAVRMEGLDVRPATGTSDHARFDLSVYLEATAAADSPPVDPPTYDVRVECSADLFDPPTADLVWDTVAQVIDRAAADPCRAVGDLDLLTPAALGELRALEQGPVVADEPSTTIHDLVRTAAEERPAATALVDARGKVSYGALTAWADEIARRLVEAGVRPGDRVAVAVPRSADMVAAMLGAMAAGAAYVPLDLSYPVDRLSFLVDDSGPAAILVPRVDQQANPETGLLGDMLAGIDVPVVVVPDRDGVVPGPAPGTVPPVAPAYLLYTSGSTGRPKGVVVSHAAAVNQLRWMQEAFPVEPGERVLQKTPTGFDVSVTEIFWPLSVGATLVQARPDGHRDPGHVHALLDEHEISTAFFVPSMLTEHLAAVPHRPRGLRQLIVTGEPVRPGLVADAHAVSGATFHNGYGPTEVAVHATSWSCEPDGTVPDRVPIGAPLRNVTAYVLDQRLRRVRPGVTGELYLAGVQLADGYHRRPGVTAERFVADPFGAPGERMYRTGDVVRRTHDGLLEFVGRTDGQVKVRGVRVELGEIEHALLAADGVREVAVVLQAPPADPAGTPRLVAHVVTDAAGTQAAEESVRVRDLARRALPSAMVPDRVAVSTSLPRLPNGKVDRSALPEVSFGGTSARRAPVGDVERAVHAAVAQVVGHDDFGTDDRFFDIGGDSIRSIAVASAVREAGYELDLRLFFDPGTVASLAAGAVPVGPTPEAPGAEAAGTDDEWDMSDLITLTDDERRTIGTEAGRRAEGRRA